MNTGIRSALVALTAAAAVTAAVGQGRRAASSGEGTEERGQVLRAPLAERVVGWPPTKGSRYPDLPLRDLEGRPVQLASLAGKVLLLEPIGLVCPGCVALCGGAEAGAFRGTRPQLGVPSVDELFADYGIDPEQPDLLYVPLLLYGTHSAAPSLEDARAWSAHFGLDARPNTLVLVGDERLVDRSTYRLIPGFQLVDRSFVLVSDGAGHRPPDHPYDELFPALGSLLR